MNNYMISWDFSKHDDSDIVLIYKPLPNGKYIIKNSYKGEEAHTLHRILTTQDKSILDIVLNE